MSMASEEAVKQLRTLMEDVEDESLRESYRVGGSAGTNLVSLVFDLDL